ncbi:MAG: hypothetical protein AUF65_01165 [Chloroflexi bacterium 13_1_20CM_50_12]|nr:MAG: hypothetical protein AUF65_01165 [Chloroflexi bacterium 13_1_20CM_50_12]
MAYGTLQIFDTIGARRAAANDYIHLYDERTLYEQLQVFLATHNRLIDMMTADLVEPTQERYMTWGTNDTIDMIEGDEFSRPDAQKVTVNPVAMGFPLRIKQAAYGVTKLFMETKTLGDLEQVITAATDADIRDRLKTIRAALFNPVNNLTYKDRWVDGITLPIRALVNADGAYIRPDQFGNIFDPNTHTHFLGTSSFADTDLLALIATVVEHYPIGAVKVYINRANESTVRGFTSGTTKFYPYYDARLTPSVNQDAALGTNLDMLSIYDRAIGIFGASEVWIKPWVPANYVFAFNTGAPNIAAQIEMYPLQAQFLEREYGIAVYERTNGACLKTDNATYSAPAAWAV